MINIAANIFYILGSSGQITFLTKYLEVQFSKSASEGTVVTGPITIFGMTIGFLISGWFITKYKPAAKFVFFWNFVIGVFLTCGQFTYMTLECDIYDSLQSSKNFSIENNCNGKCFCDGVSYSPVCDRSTNITYFSPCHAGCRYWNETSKKFTNCQCGDTFSLIFDAIISGKQLLDENIITNLKYNESQEISNILSNRPHQRKDKRNQSLINDNIKNNYFENGSVLLGSCGQSCESAFRAFTIISLCLNLLGATGRIGNILLNFR